MIDVRSRSTELKLQCEASMTMDSEWGVERFRQEILSEIEGNESVIVNDDEVKII